MTHEQAYRSIVETQGKGGIVAMIFLRGPEDETIAVASGVNVDEALRSYPDSRSQALEIAETLSNSGAIDGLYLFDESSAIAL